MQKLRYNIAEYMLWNYGWKWDLFQLLRLKHYFWLHENENCFKTLKSDQQVELQFERSNWDLFSNQYLFQKKSPMSNIGKS